MGAREGRIAAQVIRKYNEHALANGDPVKQANGVLLKGGSLREKHFNAIAALCKEREAFLVGRDVVAIEYNFTDNPGATLARRRLTQSFLYMASPLRNGAPDFNAYIPQFAKTDVTQGNILNLQRPLPVEFISGHIEDRYWQNMRGEGGLQYNSPYFRDTVRMALQLSRVMTGILIRENRRGVPVVLPFEKGMLIGEAAIRHPATYDTGYRDNLPASWRPDCSLRFKTFVDMPRLKPGQTRLHDAFMAIMHDRDSQAVLSGILDRYLVAQWHGAGLDAGRQAALDTKLRALIESHLWQKQETRGWSHISPEYQGVLRPDP